MHEAFSYIYVLYINDNKYKSPIQYQIIIMLIDADIKYNLYISRFSEQVWNLFKTSTIYKMRLST